MKLITEEIKLDENSVPNDVVSFAYAGGFMKNSRDPKLLFEYLKNSEINFRFFIFNNQPEFYEPLKKSIGEKLIVSSIIPREELLQLLNKMDFLVNLEFDPENQVPSKLIDYSLVKKPILLIQNKNFQPDVIDEFLQRNYTNQFKINNLEKYNIKNVAKKFVALANEQK